MRTAILILALSLCGPVHAAQMAFAGLPDGGLLFKNVQSVRERKFSNLVEQKTDFSCGAAALATILRQAYWLDVDEEHVIKGMLTTSDHQLVQTQGFSMLDMKRYAESIGMRARGYRIPPDKLEAVSIPVVVLMDIRGYKHFVVLQRTQKDWVYIGDPVLGHKRYTRDD
ncbi:peptidase C39, partial [Pseudomonas sp. ABAC61]